MKDHIGKYLAEQKKVMHLPSSSTSKGSNPMLVPSKQSNASKPLMKKLNTKNDVDERTPDLTNVRVKTESPWSITCRTSIFSETGWSPCPRYRPCGYTRNSKWAESYGE